jgi:hypothetical protein
MGASAFLRRPRRELTPVSESETMSSSVDTEILMVQDEPDINSLESLADEFDRAYESLTSTCTTSDLDEWANEESDLLDEEYPFLAEIEEAATLELSDISVKGSSLTVKINGKPYSYDLSPSIKGGAKEFLRKLEKIMTFSHGKALAFLKKNAQPTSSDEKSEGVSS